MSKEGGGGEVSVVGIGVGLGSLVGVLVGVGLGSLVGVLVGVGLGFWVMLRLASPSNCPDMFSSDA